MANTYLKRSLGTATSQQKGTFSYWVKRGKIGTSQQIYSNEVENDNNRGYIQFESNDSWRSVIGASGSSEIVVKTNRLFRDASAWYHIVVRIDTTQGTSTDRFRLYVNGVQETSFATYTICDQNATLKIFEGGQTNKNNIGAGYPAGSYFDGSISHFHFSDGYSYAPTVFGETDTTTGEWKGKTSPSVTYGNNGFFILKDGNGITDQSGEGNNWTVGGGTLTDLKDNPDNVFATLNPLWTQESTRVPTLTYGNTMFSGGSSSTWYQTIGTLGFSSGKYYWEAKYNAGTNLGKNLIGAIGIDGVSSGVFYEKTPSVFYKNEDGGETRVNNSQSSGNYGTLAQNDILGCAIDMDASTPTATFYKNGTALVSNISLTGFAGKTIVPAVSTYSSGEFQMNFGNGSFGGTALTGTTYSGADGSSTFQYEPPTGYSAVSTKGLNA